MSGEDFSAWLAKWTKPDGDGGEAADPPPDDAPDDGFQPTWSPRAVEVSLARALGRTPEPLPPKTPKTPEPEPAPAPAPEPAPEPSPPPKLEPDTPRSSRRPGGSTKKLTPRPKKKKLKKKKEPKEAKRRWSVRDRRESGYASEPGDAGAPARREALERPAPKDDDDESLLSSEAASPPRELSLDEQFYAAFPDKSAKDDEAEPAEDFSRPRPKSSYHRARVALAAPWGARSPAALPAVLEELRHHFCPNWRLELLRTGLHEEVLRRPAPPLAAPAPGPARAPGDVRVRGRRPAHGSAPGVAHDARRHAGHALDGGLGHDARALHGGHVGLHGVRLHGRLVRVHRRLVDDARALHRRLVHDAGLHGPVLRGGL